MAWAKARQVCSRKICCSVLASTWHQESNWSHHETELLFTGERTRTWISALAQMKASVQQSKIRIADRIILSLCSKSAILKPFHVSIISYSCSTVDSEWLSISMHWRTSSHVEREKLWQIYFLMTCFRVWRNFCPKATYPRCPLSVIGLYELFNLSATASNPIHLGNTAIQKHESPNLANLLNLSSVFCNLLLMPTFSNEKPDVKTVRHHPKCAVHL
jgi:hypothetical protein